MTNEGMNSEFIRDMPQSDWENRTWIYGQKYCV